MPEETLTEENPAPEGPPPCWWCGMPERVHVEGRCKPLRLTSFTVAPPPVPPAEEPPPATETEPAPPLENAPTAEPAPEP